MMLARGLLRDFCFSSTTSVTAACTAPLCRIRIPRDVALPNLRTRHKPLPNTRTNPRVFAILEPFESISGKISLILPHFPSFCLIFTLRVHPLIFRHFQLWFPHFPSFSALFPRFPSYSIILLFCVLMFPNFPSFGYSSLISLIFSSDFPHFPPFSGPGPSFSLIFSSG